MSSTPVAIIPYRAITGISTAGSSSGQFNAATGRIQSNVQTQTTVLVADAVIDEKHDDTLIVTDHPVEQGATISDHAYKAPAMLELTYGWSAGSRQNAGKDYSFLKNIYQQFLGLQVGRVLCTVATGKRVYRNMIMKVLSTRSDKENENVLMIRVVMQEILLATTQIVPLSNSAVQAFPNKNAPTVNQGGATLQPAPNFNPNAVRP